jgi:ribosomal protein L16 Arg81 hydroxylase
LESGAFERSGEGAESAEPVLARLIAPVPPEKFFERHYEKTPLVLKRNSPNHYGGLLRLADIDEALASLSLRSDEIDVVDAARETSVAAETYLTPKGIADPVRVAALFADGATIILPHLHRKLPRLAELCADLELVFSARFQTNVYLTPPRAQGFKTHFDTHDVFVLQVAGTKDWKIYGQPILLPTDDQAFNSRTDDPGSVTSEFTLAAGDLCYIPRGFVHDARATDGTSLHITLGVLPILWRDVLGEALGAATKRNASLRRSLPPGFAQDGFDRGEIRAEFDALLATVLNRRNLDEILDATAVRFVDQRLPPMRGQLEAMDPMRPPSGRTMFRPRPRLHWVAARKPEGPFLVRANGVEIEFPRAVEDTVRFALDRENYRAGDLPGALSPTEKLLIARRLLREGFVERIAD